MPPPTRGRKRAYAAFSEEDDSDLENEDLRLISSHSITSRTSSPAQTIANSHKPTGGSDTGLRVTSEDDDSTYFRATIDGVDGAGRPDAGSGVGFDEDALFEPEEKTPPPSSSDAAEKTPSSIKLPPAPSLLPYESSLGYDNDDGNEDDEEGTRAVQDGIATGEGSKATPPSPAELQQEWMEHYREDYLREMIWLEGRGGKGAQKYCTRCRGEGGFIYRCTSCIGAEPLCKTCILAAHEYDPFHFLEVWNGSHYEHATLKSLGLRIHLGHPPGRRCPNPQQSHNDDFVVLDTTGIHEVSLWFCGCDGMKPHHIQLLRYKLFPGTSSDPRSGATFRALKFFQILSFESKGSHEEFYRAVVRLTGNVRVKSSRDRYHEFLKMVSQWRHLKMLKRAGRGHDEGGVKKTARGSCAVRCPACPQPGVNLPSGWELEKERQWLYRLFIAIDGNFRLKRRMVSSEERDPGLNAGWAYFVEEKKFKKHLAREWDSKQERSTCVAHDAVDKPDRQAKGLAASGVVAVVCSRHEVKLPNGIGDLQKGERYINVDYIVFTALCFFHILLLVISYDIACQWHKKLMERLGKLPKSIQPHHLRGLVVLIPKFHLPAHIEYCNRTYSFNLTKGVGRTDGEAPERGWSRMNNAAKSTAEMGPGMRRDTLDDHIGDEAWELTKGMIETLVKKMIRAVAGSAQHGAAFDEFAKSIPEKFVEAWLSAVEKWEADPSNEKNPFEAETRGISEQAIRLQLAKEAEEADKARGDDDGGEDSGVMHPSLFISLGIQLEEDQHKLHLAASSLGNHPTKKQLTTMAERSNTLRRRIAVWIDVQKLHVPEAEARRRQHDYTSTVVDGKPSSESYEIPLFLPSSLPTASCTADLRHYETRLREGQAYDALNDVQRYLRLRSYLYKRKDAYSRGVAQNTRSNVAITRAQKSINLAAAKYDRAYKALMHLCGEEPTPEKGDEEGWRKDLRVLRLKDIRGLSEGLYGETEGTREISWIWKSRSAADLGESEGNIDADEQLQDALRVEYLRSRARAMRWQEEVILLKEEMRRTLQTFRYKVDWWFSKQKSTLPGPSTPDYEEGFSAYALSQCSVFQSLHKEGEQRVAEGDRTGWAKPKRGKKVGVGTGVGAQGATPTALPAAVVDGQVKLEEPYDDFD